MLPGEAAVGAEFGERRQRCREIAFKWYGGSNGMALMGFGDPRRTPL